jgi:alkylation response protein AidB-like acyl-CoA dehydrogenase
MTTLVASEAPLDAVGAVLGSRFAELRSHVLADLLPELDRAVADVPEEDELAPVLRLLAADPNALLDGRQDGDLGIRAATVATEALATGRQTYLIPVLVSALTRMPIVLAGTEEQRSRFLADVATAPVGAFGMTEATPGSDVAGLGTVAREDGDVTVLDGRKCWITVQDQSRLEWVVVWAKAAGGGPHALSCFVVPVGTPGLEVRRQDAAPLGMRSVPLCEVVLDGVRVGPECRIGEPGRAFGLAMRCLNSVRCVVGARGLGLAARVLMDASTQVQERPAFGGTLADRQSVRAKIADLAARLEAARMLTYRAAAIADAGGLGKPEGPVLGATKYLGTELAVEAATTALHLAGALGYDERSTMFSRHLRDAQQLTLVEGVSEVQLELIGYGVLEKLLWWDA